MPVRSRSNRTVTYETAGILVAQATQFARSRGWNIAVAVLDPGGGVVSAGRMDGVSPAVLDYANDKAFTALLGKSSKAFYERMSSSPDLHMGMMNRPRLCAWEGGVPIYENGMLIGGLGVSGAEGDEDASCAKEALKFVGLQCIE